jgi:folate-binding protein YgfZ
MTDVQKGNIHKDHRATYSEGGTVVANYGDVEAEYRAVLNSAGLIDRSAMGKLKVTGSDRVRFLHGMLTNTVEALVPGQGNHTVTTTPQGHTLTDLNLYCLDDAFLLETEPGIQQKLMSVLDKFLIADDVALEDVSEQFAIIGVQGPNAKQVIGDSFGQLPGELLPFESVTIDFESVSLLVICHSFTGEQGYEVWVTREAASTVWPALEDSGAIPVGLEAIEILRVEAGIPKYGLDIDERVMPQEAGIPSAVDFAKGCFIGQEALAKMQNLGKPRRYLCGLSSEGDTPLEANIRLSVDGKQVGWTTSSVVSIHNGRISGMASIRRGYQTEGQQIRLEDGRCARVEKLPFRPTKGLHPFK